MSDVWKDYPTDGTNFEAWIESDDIFDPAHVIMNCIEEDDWRCSHRYTDTTYNIIFDFDKKLNFRSTKSYLQIFKSRAFYFSHHIVDAHDDVQNAKDDLKEKEALLEKLYKARDAK